MGWGQRGRSGSGSGSRSGRAPSAGERCFRSLVGPLTQRCRVSTWCGQAVEPVVCQRACRIYIEADRRRRTFPTAASCTRATTKASIDILVLGAALPGDFKWAAKRSVMNVPFLGWHLRLAGHVPVDRNQGKDAATAVTDAFEGVLRDDKPLLVFPEGTRTEDGNLRPFKNGAFQAAVLTGKPVVPVAIRGTFTLMSRDEVDIGGSKAREDRLVTVQIGKPIYPSTELEEPEAVADLRDRTRATVVEMLAAVSSAEAAGVSAQRL